VKKPIPKDKLILIGLPVFGLLIGLFGYLALVSPQKSKANNLAAQVDTARAALVAAKSKRAPKPKAVPVRATDILRLTKAMPDTPDLPGIVLNLTRTAEQSSVSVTGIRPAPPIPLTDGYGVVPVVVMASGTFPALSNFLHRLRRQAWIDKHGGVHVDGRLLVGDQVAFSTGTGGLLSATLNLNAFVYGLAAAPPAPTTTTANGTTTTPTTTTSAGGS